MFRLSLLNLFNCCLSSVIVRYSRMSDDWTVSQQPYFYLQPCQLSLCCTQQGNVKINSYISTSWIHIQGVDVLVHWFPVAVLEGDEWSTSRSSPFTSGTQWTERYMNARDCLEIMEKRTTYFIRQDSNPDSSGLQPGHTAYYIIYFRHSRKWRNLGEQKIAWDIRR